MARIRRARVPRAAPWRRLSERGGAATGWVDRAVPDRVCSHFTMVALRRTVDRAGVVGEEGASVTGDGVRIECHRGGVLSETGRGAGETGSARAAPRPPGTARARGARRQSLAARPGSVVESGCAVYTRNAKKQEARMLLHPALSEWARCACARAFTDETRVRGPAVRRGAHTRFSRRETRGATHRIPQHPARRPDPTPYTRFLPLTALDPHRLSSSEDRRRSTNTTRSQRSRASTFTTSAPQRGCRPRDTRPPWTRRAP